MILKDKIKTIKRLRIYNNQFNLSGFSVNSPTKTVLIDLG